MELQKKSDMKRTAGIIIHVKNDNLGKLNHVLNQRGYKTSYRMAGIDPLEDFKDVDLLILMGGPIGANDENTFPFIQTELDLIKRRLDNERPIFGICLGAQLIAKAAGAKINTKEVKEYGWKSMQLTSDGAVSCLKYLEDIRVFHWHEDTFTIPKEARLLAFTPHCSKLFFNIINSQEKPKFCSSMNLYSGIFQWELYLKKYAFKCFETWIKSLE